MSSPCTPAAGGGGEGWEGPRQESRRPPEGMGILEKKLVTPVLGGRDGGGQTKHQANRRPRGGNIEHQLGGMTERGHPRTRAEQTFQW